jgi:ribose-phosphate pyrophosphokinase
LKPFAKGAVVVAPDRGARLRAMQLAALLGGLPTAFVEKTRPAPDAVVARGIRGASLKGKTVILIDDIIDTAGTMRAAAALVKKSGATRVVIAATHGVCSGTARASLIAAADAVFLTNSLPQIPHKKIHVVDVSPVLAAAVASYA